MQPETTIMPKPGDKVWYFDSAAHFDEYQRGNPEIKPYDATVDSVVGANCVNLEVTVPEDAHGKVGTLSRSGVTLWQPAEEGRGFPNGPHARWPDDRVGQLRQAANPDGTIGEDSLAAKLATYQEAHVSDTNRTVPALKPEASELENSDKPLVGEVGFPGSTGGPGPGSVGHPEHGHPQAAPTTEDLQASATESKPADASDINAQHSSVNEAAREEAKAVEKEEADKKATDESQGNSNRNNPGRKL